MAGPGGKNVQDVSLMPLGDHLEELRRRLIFAIGGLVPVLVFSLVIGQWLMGVLTGPVEARLREANLPVRLIQTSPTESFGAYLKVAVVLTVILGLPWGLYQLWMFIAPGLLPREKRFVHLLVPFSGVLSAAGALFMYIVMLPVVLSFFIAFSLAVSPAGSVQTHRVTDAQAEAAFAATGAAAWPEVPVLAGDLAAPTAGQVWVNTELNELRVAVSASSAPKRAPAAGDAVPQETGEGGGGAAATAAAASPAVVVLGVPLRVTSFIQQEYRISEYLSFVLTLALAFAVAFQMPVVVLLLGWVGVVTPAWLGRVRKPAIMVCAVLGAVLTPSDPLSMILLAVPLYALYELGIFMLRVAPASRVFGKDEGDDDADWPSPFDDNAARGGGS